MKWILGTGYSIGKKYEFWELWWIFKEHIKQNIIMAVLRKANSHSVAICGLIKKINIVKRRSKEKNWIGDFDRTADGSTQI